VKIAVLGTGLMGRPLAERLKSVGHTVIVYNRTREKADPLRRMGIAVAERPGDAIREAECVLVMLADAPAIRSVLLGDPAAQELAGRTVIQMGTIGPGESQAIRQEVIAAGGDYLEAPVLGSIAEAKAGTLLIMVGASPEQFAQWSGLFREAGRDARLIGPVGKAAALKLALNQLIAAEMTAFALSLGLVQREGVAVEAFMAVLRESALFAPAFEKKLPRLLARDYANPNFSVRLLLKDVDLFLREAARVGLNTANLEGVRPILAGALAQGLGEADYSALFNVVNPQA